jgi:secreted trypsin-like serine protease
MLTRNITTLVLAASLVAPVVHAIEENYVTDEEFANHDYVVNIATPNGRCGGQLIANKYIITAAHCIDKGTENYEKILQNQDGDIDMSLFGDITTYLGSRVRGEGTAIKASAITVNPVYIYDRLAPERIAFVNAIREEFDQSGGLEGDIAIITLESPYLNQTAAKLQNKDLFREKNDSGDTLIHQDAPATWIGWGVLEDGSSSLNAKTRSVMFNPHSKYVYDDITYDARLSYSNFDSTHYTTTDGGATASAGDSGTPVIVNNKVQGYWTSGEFGSIYSTSTRNAYHLNWIASQINSVNTIGQVRAEFEGETSLSKTWTIPVQSLMIDDVSFTPYIDDDSGLFIISESNCDGTFSTGEDCDITISFNPNKDSVTGNIKSKLILNNDVFVELNIINIAATTPVVTPVVTGPDSSGGGTMAWVSIIALGFLRLLRK